MADSSTARGGGAVNPFQLTANGTPDFRCFDCPSGSCHLVDDVATGTVSHAHHQAIIEKDLLPVYGALTTFVIDTDPINPDTFAEDVAEIVRATTAGGPRWVGVRAPSDRGTDRRLLLRAEVGGLERTTESGESGELHPSPARFR